MKIYQIPSCFNNTSTLIYHYPARNDSEKVLLLLKGLYGEHKPTGDDVICWDMELIKLVNDNYHVLVIQSGRLAGITGISVFVGKTFDQECSDVEKAFKYCLTHLFNKEMRWMAIGSSFGGTTILGASDVLLKMETVVLIGSGSGKSENTTKPLLSTLFETEKLLSSLQKYVGNFFFLHGTHDDVVPLDSQRKIYDSLSKNIKYREWIECSEHNHQLINVNTNKLETSKLLLKIISQFF